MIDYTSSLLLAYQSWMKNLKKNSTAFLSIVLLHLTVNVYLSQEKRRRQETCPQNRLKPAKVRCVLSDFWFCGHILHWTLFLASAALFSCVIGFRLRHSKLEFQVALQDYLGSCLTSLSFLSFLILFSLCPLTCNLIHLPLKM